MTTTILMLLLWAAPAIAQDEFRLNEADEWEQTSGGVLQGEADLVEARRLLAEKEYDRARKLAHQWIKQNPDHPLMPRAYIIRGDAKLGQGNLYKALFDYEAIARVYPSSDVFIPVLEREFEIAVRFAHGQNRKIWGMPIAPATSEAEELLIRIQERLPGSALAERAGLQLGDFYFRTRQIDLATEAYQLFIENYPRSDRAGVARERLIASLLAGFKGPEYDGAGLYAARERLREMIVAHPAEAQEIGARGLIASIDERDAAKMLSTARWYLRTNNPVAAEFTLRRVVEKYGQTATAIEVIRMIPDVLDRLPEALRNEVSIFYRARGAALPPDDAPERATREGDGG